MSPLPSPAISEMTANPMSVRRPLCWPQATKLRSSRSSSRSRRSPSHTPRQVHNEGGAAERDSVSSLGCWRGSPPSLGLGHTPTLSGAFQRSAVGHPCGFRVVCPTSLVCAGVHTHQLIGGSAPNAARSGSLAELRLCMVMHVGNSGGSRAWQGLLGRRRDWESAHPGSTGVREGSVTGHRSGYRDSL
jgi:hypothetical protein